MILRNGEINYLKLLEVNHRSDFIAKPKCSDNFTGTALPTCHIPLFIVPSKKKLSGKVCNLAISLTVKDLA